MAKINKTTAGIMLAAVISGGAIGAAALPAMGEASWPEVLDVLEVHGPTELIARTRRAEATDPHGPRWPRYKRGDDATAAYCTFP